MLEESHSKLSLRLRSVGKVYLASVPPTPLPKSTAEFRRYCPTDNKENGDAIAVPFSLTPYRSASLPPHRLLKHLERIASGYTAVGPEHLT